MPEKMLDILYDDAERIRQEGVRLLKDFSEIYPMKPGSRVRMLNAKGNYGWHELSPAGKQIQYRLLSKIDSFTKMTRFLKKKLPSDYQRRIDISLETMRELIEQSYTTWNDSNEKATEKFQDVLVQRELEILRF